MRYEIGRRRFLTGLMTSGLAGLSLTALTKAALGQGLSLSPTPTCGDDDEVTIAQTEGPFFTPNSPERATLREAGFAGTPITLAGMVVTRSCQPVPNALVELWHANDSGEYDNAGYNYRGHIFTDGAGQYRFETIVPGLYTGRTRHFHLKFQAANQPVLTTQFYFPDEPGNERDGIFDPELVVTLLDQPSLTAWYTTVLDLA